MKKLHAEESKTLKNSRSSLSDYMGFFRRPILTKKREKELTHFRNYAIKALRDLEKKETNHSIKELYQDMSRNIERTPLFFYDAQNLRSNVFRVGNKIFGSVTKGEHVRQIMVFQQGPNRYIKNKNYINLPAEHIFKGDRMSMDGIFTLAHEYGHFPKRHVDVFADAYSLNEEQAEELLADILSAKLAVKMGYPKSHVLRHYLGREIVYGTFPFRQFIKDAVK